MDRDNTIKTIQNDYANELNGFIEENPLLNEDYFIGFKLRGLNEVIKAFEDVGEFFSGNDEFLYGIKAVNRNQFGYYILYRDFLNSKQNELKLLNNTSNLNVDSIDLKLPVNDKGFELFEYLIVYYRPEESTKVKFVNILYYLKNDTNKNLYVFKVKQKEYKTIIKEKFGIDIKKFAKSERYNEDEKPVFRKLERDFNK